MYHYMKNVKYVKYSFIGEVLVQPMREEGSWLRSRINRDEVVDSNGGFSHKGPVMWTFDVSVMLAQAICWTNSLVTGDLRLCSDAAI